MKTQEIDKIVSSSYGHFHPIIGKKKKNNEQSIMEHIAEWNQVFKLYPDPVYILDLEGVFHYVNDAFEKVTDYREDEICGKKFITLTQTNYQEIVTSYLHKVHQGEVVQFPLTLIVKNSKIIESEITCVPITIGGEIKAVLNIAKDVTIQNQKKEKLRLIQKRYKLIEENSFDMISKNSLQGTFTYVSPASRELLGYQPSELFGKNFWDFLHHQDSRKVYKTINNLGLSQEKITYRFRKKDGTYTWFESIVKILFSSTNQPIEFLCISRDISERKKAEEILEESNQRYRRLIHNSLDTIAIIADHKFVFINDSGVKMFEAENYIDIHDRNLYEFLKPEYHEICRERIQHVLEHQEAVKLMDQEWVTLKGKTLYTEVISLPTMYMNQPAVQVIIRDITERKKAEELMLQSEKLSIAGQLAAGVAHEIRNPLTSLKGFIQLMESGANEKQIYYDIMKSELNRIELILSELLMLSKPQVQNFKNIDIRFLIQQVVTLLDTQAIINNIQIIKQFTVDPLIIRCDENQIKQVFINFLKNSIEAMPNGGNIIIKAENVDNYAEITLEDEGCGIPEEIIDKIGQPFYTTKEKGTGLGMMVSYNIIENHQGRIELSSQVNKGTKFTVYIPTVPK